MKLAGKALPSDYVNLAFAVAITLTVLMVILTQADHDFEPALAESRLVARLWLVPLAGIALWQIYQAFLVFSNFRQQLTLKNSLRAVGWIPVVTSLAFILLALFSTDNTAELPWSDAGQVVEVIVPLAVGVQAALLFSPTDEEPLEIFLSYPRPSAWIMLERIAAAFLTQAGVALVGITLSLAVEKDLLVALVRWIPTAIFFAGIGAYVTLKSRVAAFGVVVTGIVWFAFLLFREWFLPGRFMLTPLNYIQPYFWSFSAYLKPDDLTVGDYVLNRAILLSVGVNLLALAALHCRNEELLLVGTSPKLSEETR